mmetsp:Transcript_14602/g.21774  ORF Transcript_14602/g.21774 Transcript_14602/m.21774 type:complete len:161 (+) Transcript_14602:334-816(+)|eukprot:CAMPEP_0170074174 /NCGR_PEP_ID=MMETSP0019_2-20121128/11509_1 /TAXON_ID=98059 /ORGANISM="Dinobryon sp., Strain UTEXLB2267" /LENGTH=160 /DNA_ID=CAMNT_0010284275 /DNA_START=21 /DNA_END=503 /DNA_ORIENTATION=-
MAFGNVLKIYNSLKTYPCGKTLFSYFFAYNAPYFLNLRATVNDLQSGHASVSMKQRWAVQNHIKTVHAIAVCNLIEMTMGLVAEASIPHNLRWLPMGMDVNYLKKASGRLTASSSIDPSTFFALPNYPGEVRVPVEVTNSEGIIVTKADVKLWISKKPTK